MLELTKHEQVKRAFGIKTPDEKFRLAVVSRDDPDHEPYHPVTPFHKAVAAARWVELEGLGFAPSECAIILLMRGSRIEVLAALVDETPDDFAGICQRRHAQLTRDRREALEDRAARNVRLSEHAGARGGAGTDGRKYEAGTMSSPGYFG